MPVPAGGQILALPSRNSTVELRFDLLTGRNEYASEYRVNADGAAGDNGWSNDNRLKGTEIIINYLRPLSLPYVIWRKP